MFSSKPIKFEALTTEFTNLIKVKDILNDNSFTKSLSHLPVCVNLTPSRHLFSNNFFQSKIEKHLCTTQTQALCTLNFTIFFWHAKLCGHHFISSSGYVIIVHISWKKKFLLRKILCQIFWSWQDKRGDSMIYFIRVNYTNIRQFFCFVHSRVFEWYIHQNSLIEFKFWWKIM